MRTPEERAARDKRKTRQRWFRRIAYGFNIATVIAVAFFAQYVVDEFHESEVRDARDACEDTNGRTEAIATILDNLIEEGAQGQPLQIEIIPEADIILRMQLEHVNEQLRQASEGGGGAVNVLKEERDRLVFIDCSQDPPASVGRG